MRNSAKRGRGRGGGRASTSRRKTTDTSPEAVVTVVKRTRRRKQPKEEEDDNENDDNSGTYTEPELCIPLPMAIDEAESITVVLPQLLEKQEHQQQQQQVIKPKTVRDYRRKIIHEGGILSTEMPEDQEMYGMDIGMRRPGMMIQNNRNKNQEIRIIMANQPTRMQLEAFVTNGLPGCTPVITSIERFMTYTQRHNKIVCEEIEDYVQEKRTRFLEMDTQGANFSDLTLEEFVQGNWRASLELVISGCQRLYQQIKSKYRVSPRVCLLHRNMDVVSLSMICEMGLKLWLGPCRPDKTVGDCVWIPFHPTIKDYCGNPLCGRPIEFSTPYHRCVECKQVIYCERSTCRLVGSYLHRKHCSHDPNQESHSYFKYFVTMQKIDV